MTFRVEVEQETDDRWIAEVVELAGALGEEGPSLLNIAFRAA